jgi:hypothetical protein
MILLIFFLLPYVPLSLGRALLPFGGGVIFFGGGIGV